MWYLHRPSRIKGYIARNKRNEERIRQKDSITVVFFASNLAMWKYQELYEEMLRYPRYIPYIVLTPLSTFTFEQKKKNIEELRLFFKNKQIQYIDYNIEKMKGFDVKNKLKPDLIFHSQPYLTAHVKEHRYYRFSDSLLGYYPYGITIFKGDFFNEDYCNKAWKRYYENSFFQKICKENSSIGDKNVVIVGAHVADEYAKPHKDIWKKQSQLKKRIIWATHFTINDDGWSGLSSNFLKMADYMLLIAKKYESLIQIAFKPHPRLLTELYKHKEWGKEKTDRYYEAWNEMNNTQLEQGDYYNLFAGSDAMIHDCGSFAAEYIYTENPVMYISKNFTNLYNEVHEFGKLILDLHYKAKELNDIEDFICRVVIKGDDPKKDERKFAKKTYLDPPNGKTVAQNIMDDLNRSLDCKI